MSTKLPWFRMYTDFLNDAKIIALAFEDQRHFIGLLALKSDGALDEAVEESLLDRIVAQRLWIDHGVIREVKKRLVAAGLIDTSWQPLAWDKRQFKSDSSKDRVAKFRASKKDGNGDVTLQKRKSNAVDTDTDTDTDTEKEKEKDSAGEPAVPAKPARSSRGEKTLKTYLAECKTAGVKPIPDDHVVRRYCKSVGITMDMAAIAWMRFREEHITGTRKAKRYADWPATFHNSVKANWYKLWVVNTEGEANWTSLGIQARRAIEAEEAA